MDESNLVPTFENLKQFEFSKSGNTLSSLKSTCLAKADAKTLNIMIRLDNPNSIETLEFKLKRAVKSGSVNEAEDLLKKINREFTGDEIGRMIESCKASGHLTQFFLLTRRYLNKEPGAGEVKETAMNAGVLLGDRLVNFRRSKIEIRDDHYRALCSACGHYGIFTDHALRLRRFVCFEHAPHSHYGHASGGYYGRQEGWRKEAFSSLVLNFD